jgi:sulfofructose kinase
LTELAGQTRVPRILCAGGAVQDNVMRVAQFPAAGSKVTGSDFLVTIGGQSGNAAVAVARLGAKTSYAGPLGCGDDAIANWVVKTLEGEQIDCTHAVRAPGGATSVSIIMVDAAGEKMIATRRGRELTEIAPADATKAVADADCVLLDNRYPEFCMPIAAAARKRGIPRVLDFDWGAPADDPLLSACSHVISSAEALHGSTGLRDLSAGLRKLGAHYEGFLAVTDGPGGIYWLEDGEVRHKPAFQVETIDTLGAGDVFHGAFAFRLVETDDVVESMRFAAAAAAIRCTRFGMLTAVATRAEVDDFLKRQG